MDATQFTKVLRSYYLKRDVLNVIKLVNEFKKTSGFVQLFQKLVKRKKIDPSSGNIESIIRALLYEIENDIKQNRRLAIDATFYDIAEHFKKKYNQQVGEIYLESQIPSDFISKVRSNYDEGDNSKLTETLVTNYKSELVRLEKGRRNVMAVLQSSSNFPVINTHKICDLLDELQQKLRSNYKYLSVKPYFLAIAAIGDSIDAEHPHDAESDDTEKSLLSFRHYQISGQEPPIIHQVELQIAINRLFQFLKNNELLTKDELNHYWTNIGEILSYKGDGALSPKEWKILSDLLVQINSDINTISYKLVATFIDEYKCAEEQMRLRHIIIQNELAFTEEYLNQVAQSDELSSQADPDKIHVAIDKVFCLKETFPISEKQKVAAANKSFVDIERAALGVSTVISPKQLTDWIKIYSIIFSNTEYLAQYGKRVDFSTMRELISNLTTFHLYDNIAQLKNIIERSLSSSSRERSSQFKRFNDALKQKLLGLMGTKDTQELSLQEMIEELGFLENKSIQFVIAETFKGFQYIVDAFNTSSTDYFVRDQDAMLKESRVLYNQICNKSLKIFNRDSSKNRMPAKLSENTHKKSWIAKLFS